MFAQYQRWHPHQGLQNTDDDYGDRDHLDREAHGHGNLLYEILHELRASANERMTGALVA